jgi:hypothetical protein
MRSNGHFMCECLEGVAGSIPLHAWTSIRLPSVHAIDAETGRRGPAFQPVYMRYHQW